MFQVKVEFNGNKLVVTESKLNHRNHSLDQKTFDHYPESMRLSKQHEEEARSMIAVGGNKKQIKTNIMKKSGKPVMMKTLHNLQSKMQNEMHKGAVSDLQKLYDALAAVPGAKVRFISNEVNEFVGK